MPAPTRPTPTLLTAPTGLTRQPVNAAKPYSLWQMLILVGALEVRPMQGELLSYEVPTYFGMLSAAYQGTFPPSIFKA